LSCDTGLFLPVNIYITNAPIKPAATLIIWNWLVPLSMWNDHRSFWDLSIGIKRSASEVMNSYRLTLTSTSVEVDTVENATGSTTYLPEPEEKRTFNGDNSTDHQRNLKLTMKGNSYEHKKVRVPRRRGHP
jgi:hypothetical protein